MYLSGKKGQFFFVATLIIVIIILSLTSIYTTIDSNNKDSTYEYLAQNIKYESNQIINNGYYNGDNFEKINSNLIDFVREYSSIYPTFNITIISGISQNPETFNHTSFLNGRAFTDDYILTSVGEKITLDLNSLDFSFNKSKGFNFNVIVLQSNEKGRFISSA